MKVDIHIIEKFIDKLAEVVAEIFQRIKRAFQWFSENQEAIEEFFKRQIKIQKIRSSWVIKYDTRKPSQITNNKPRNIVRKVIR